MHLAGGFPEEEPLQTASIKATVSPTRSRLLDQIEEFEDRVAYLEREFGLLRDMLE